MYISHESLIWRAVQCVSNALDNPTYWAGHAPLESEVLYANDVFTVGCNGDYHDADNVDAAVRQLVGMWEEELEADDVGEKHWFATP